MARASIFAAFFAGFLGDLYGFSSIEDCGGCGAKFAHPRPEIICEWTLTSGEFTHHE
jgi:hypothetical protein